MFRRVLGTALLILLLLCGCSAVSHPEDKAAAVKAAYESAANIELVTDIASNLDEETMSYRIGYAYHKQDNGNATAQMTVLAPESIAGIQAEITGEDFLFTYEGTELETAMPDRKGLTPADVTTYLLYDLMNTVPEQVWMEGELLALRFEEVTDECTAVKEVYLNAETGALSEARIYCDGKQIMRCTFASCTLNGK